jgi:glycosyltransferase involved in cell wall biosynthesis
MKILIPVYDFGRQGGYRVLSQLANFWIDLGHEVTFVTLHSSNEPYFPTKAKIIYIDAFRNYFSRFFKWRITSKNNFLKDFIELTFGLRHMVDDYDIIMANFSLTTYPIFLSFPKKAKKVYYIQAYEPEYFVLKTIKSSVLRFLSKMSYRLPFFHVCNSPIYFSYPEIKSKDWIPPGIDLNTFNQKECKNYEFKNLDQVIIGCIGRNEPSKGIKYVLEAFETLSQLDSRFVLHIAYGNLPVNWSNSRAKIVLLENDSDLSEFYKEIDILIAPGTVQLGAVHYPALEALASGACLITTGFLPANDKNAWIVPISNASAIVESVLMISQLNAKQINAKVENGLKAVESYSWEVVSKAFIAVFDDLRSKSNYLNIVKRESK